MSDWQDNTREHLELYIAWYNEDVIPGFQRQAEKNRYYDKEGKPRPNAFDDAIASSIFYRDDLVERLARVNALEKSTQRPHNSPPLNEMDMTGESSHG